MTMETFFSLLTLLLLLIFIGIVAWAYSKRRKQDFEEAANLPLEDDKPAERRMGGDRDHE
ncbi:cbb3-type cytochrome oxidase subunit 3 [Natronospira bacteriovora]|uniref:Cbb3-type cytochrome c oxidase subunit 3 n=1 Tax=Natronospira bacteriovora TaxID=3069753 RepID=A0ABU0W8Q5_9GAMM|nr:cbb3-type cytochrome c oxidase subunit 3 [Natronospira sp. AB-CW4]MDQ2070413.1 cbb3-type cytochrome c oxidase subunit 3 [Natronospira sp. AB-CW4]